MKGLIMMMMGRGMGIIKPHKEVMKVVYFRRIKKGMSTISITPALI